MSAAQAVLPGLEAYIKPIYTWQPVPKTLARLKSYLEGYAAHGKEIYARRRYIADKLGIAVRTLARYLRYLTETGWLATLARKAYHAVRKVCKAAGPSAGPSIKEESKPIESLRIQRSQGPPPLVDPPKSGWFAIPREICEIIERAAGRIRRAKNPAAYRQAIISCELRLLDATPKPTPAKIPDPDPVPIPLRLPAKDFWTSIARNSE